MKRFLFLALTIALMTSCSQNDDLTEATPPKLVPISFAPQFGNSVATRADVALDNSVSLGVFAYNNATIYDGIEDMRMRYVTAETAWFLNPAEHYYPADGSEVSFWAYGPKGNTHFKNMACNATQGPKFTLTLNSTDIGPTAMDIFATQAVATGKLTSASTKIGFTLKHLLAQVAFKAKTSTAAEATDYDVKIYDIQISTFSDGDYANSLWTVPASGKTANDTIVWKPVDADDTQAVLTETATSIGEKVSLIPGGKTRIIVKARVYKKNQSVMVTEQTSTLLLDNTSGKEFLAPGNSYTYTVSVSPKVGRIMFDAPRITDWTAADKDISVPPVAP